VLSSVCLSIPTLVGAISGLAKRDLHNDEAQWLLSSAHILGACMYSHVFECDRVEHEAILRSFASRVMRMRTPLSS
jgi:hypothetical protein